MVSNELSVHALKRLSVDAVVREVSGLTVLDVSGKILGGQDSERLRLEVERILATGERRLLINLTRVPWMNSAGLGILLSAYSRMKRRGGAVRFFGAGRRVLGILRTTKLLTVLDVLDDEGEAIRGFTLPQSAPKLSSG
jgi:anti-sigma B factor antagonist